MEVLAAALYVAFLSVVPVSSRMVGVPPAVSTVTASSNSTCTTIVDPALYESSVVEDVTDETVGSPVSTMMAFESPSEPGSPGSFRSRSASLPAASRMVPPLRDRAVVPV